jgi:hypothetical protein
LYISKAYSTFEPACAAVLDTIFIGAALLAPNVLRRKVGNVVSYKHDLILGKLVFGMAILQS